MSFHQSTVIVDTEVTLLRQSDSPVRLHNIEIQCSDSFTIQAVMLVCDYVCDYGIREGF